jgi:hypothetical protein
MYKYYTLHIQIQNLSLITATSWAAILLEQEDHACSVTDNTVKTSTINDVSTSWKWSLHRSMRNYQKLRWLKASHQVTYYFAVNGKLYISRPFSSVGISQICQFKCRSQCLFYKWRNRCKNSFFGKTAEIMKSTIKKNCLLYFLFTFLFTWKSWEIQRTNICTCSRQHKNMFCRTPRTCKSCEKKHGSKGLRWNKWHVNIFWRKQVKDITLWCGGSFPRGMAQPGRDADHSPPSSAEVKKE